MNLFLSLICSFTASITLYNFFRKAILPHWIKKYLSEMGKFSLVIYVVPIVLLPKSFIFPDWMSSTLVDLGIIVIGIVITMLRYTFGRIIFEIPILRFIMFGKK